MFAGVRGRVISELAARGVPLALGAAIMLSGRCDACVCAQACLLLLPRSLMGALQWGSVPLEYGQWADTPVPFRQERNFLAVTGMYQPEVRWWRCVRAFRACGSGAAPLQVAAVAIITPGSANGTLTLFVAPPEPRYAIWNGVAYSLLGIQTATGADAVLWLPELPSWLAGAAPEIDSVLLLPNASLPAGTAAALPSAVVDTSVLGPAMAAARAIKSDAEVRGGCRYSTSPAYWLPD